MKMLTRAYKKKFLIVIKNEQNKKIFFSLFKEMATGENRYGPVARDRKESSIALWMTSLNSCAIG